LYARGHTLENIHPAVVVWPKSELEYPFFALHILNPQRKAFWLRNWWEIGLNNKNS